MAHKSEYIQTQQIPPEIDPEDPNALYEVIRLAKSLYKEVYDTKQRIEELESIIME